LNGTWTGGYLSARSRSTKDFAQALGILELRCRFSGQLGIVYAFFLVSQKEILTNGDFPRIELDAFEKPKEGQIYMTLHNGTASQGTRYNQVEVPPDFNHHFHVTSVLKLEDGGLIQCFITGQLTLSKLKYNDTDRSPIVMTLEADVDDPFTATDTTTATPHFQPSTGYVCDQTILKTWCGRSYNRPPQETTGVLLSSDIRSAV
jgi:hypothetical protein